MTRTVTATDGRRRRPDAGAEVLALYRSGMSDWQVAERMPGRFPNREAVRHWRRRLGLPANRAPRRPVERYRPRADRFFALYRAGLCDREIAVRMPAEFPGGRRAVACHRDHRGLRPNPDPLTPATQRVARFRRLAAAYGLPADLPPSAVKVAVALADGPATRGQLRRAAGVGINANLGAVRRLKAYGLVREFRPGPQAVPLLMLSAAGMAALAGEGGGTP